jgi:NAD(P)-dependent dehydrogenase (short-subunit alcohol dehydrogenase family)
MRSKAKLPEAGSDGRVALVTGAAGGIGAAVAARLARDGLTVALADIDHSGVTASASRLGKPHCAFHLDVADESSVRSCFDAVEAQLGPVAVLVNVAGLLIMPGGERPLIKDLSLDIWEQSMAVNARGSFLSVRDYLQRRELSPLAGGRVIFFGSVAAQLGGYRSSAAYIAAKAAVMGFAKAVARESAHLGITSNTIAPGLIDTNMLRSTVTSSGALEAAASNIPLGRIGTVDDVADAVAYLVSRAADYITGSVIDVNGGYRMQ